jgi:hypothetical protein
MFTITNAAPATETETRPETKTAPVETMPANPNDPFGVDRKLIEEIEEIGRRYSRPRR